MTLLWSPESIHDLLALRDHINEHDPAAAKRVALHILYCVEYLLSENPKLGAPGRVPGTRELVIPKTPYIVPYRVRHSTIEIVRVYHASRRWPDRLYHHATARATCRAARRARVTNNQSPPAAQPNHGNGNFNNTIGSHRSAI